METISIHRFISLKTKESGEEEGERDFEGREIEIGELKSRKEGACRDATCVTAARLFSDAFSRHSIRR